MPPRLAASYALATLALECLAVCTCCRCTAVLASVAAMHYAHAMLLPSHGTLIGIHMHVCIQPGTVMSSTALLQDDATHNIVPDRIRLLQAAMNVLRDCTGGVRGSTAALTAFAHEATGWLLQYTAISRPAAVRACCTSG